MNDDGHVGHPELHRKLRKSFYESFNKSQQISCFWDV